MQKLSRTFKALSDQTRLEILALLLRYGELCVCDLENALQVPHSKASRHLRYLLNAGLVLDRRQSMWVYYRLKDPLDDDQLTVVAALSEVLTDDRIAGAKARLDDWIRQKGRDDNSSCP